MWEDVDDDIEWYESAASWAKENLLAPVASITVGALCYSAAVGGSTVTGGASLAGAAYCGGLAAATYNATNTWAHGGSAGDVVNSFTDLETWAYGATEGLVFQGATNYLLRNPAVRGTAGGAASSADEVARAVDDLPTSPATPSGNQYSVAHEMQLDPGRLGSPADGPREPGECLPRHRAQRRRVLRRGDGRPHSRCSRVGLLRRWSHQPFRMDLAPCPIVGSRRSAGRDAARPHVSSTLLVRSSRARSTRTVRAVTPSGRCRRERPRTDDK